MAEVVDLQRLVVSMEANLKKYEREMQRATGIADREGGKIQQKFKAVNDNLTAQTGNLAAQFQDIFVSLQGGQSPLTVALQQGTQISAVLGDRGAAGAVKSLGAAFLSVVSPVSLATIGIIALGGVAAKYVLGAGGDIKSLDDVIKDHSDLIAKIKEAYGEAIAGANDYGKESGVVLRTMLRNQANVLRGEIDKIAQDLTSSVSKVLPSLGQIETGLSGGPALVEISAKYEVFRTAIEGLRASVAAGKPDLDAYRQAIAAVAEADPNNPQIQTLAASLLDAARAGAEAQARLAGIEGVIRGIENAAGASADSIKRFSGALKTLQGISLNLDARARAYEAYSIAISNAATANDRVKAELEYQRALTRTDQVEAEAAAKKASRATAENPRDRYADTVAFLELEIEKAGLVGAARDVVLAKEREIQFLRRAGVSTLSEEGQNIIRLVQLEAEREAAARKTAEAQRAINDAAQFAGSQIYGAFDSLILQGKELNDVLEDITKSLIRAALQAAIFGGGPLAGLFGTKGENGNVGGLIGGLVSSFGGARATGGPVAGGTSYLVGEKGPELFTPNQSGRIIPNDAIRGGGGGGVVVQIVNNAPAAKARTEPGGRSNGREIVKVLVEEVRQEMARGGFDGAQRARYGVMPRKVTR